MCDNFVYNCLSILTRGNVRKKESEKKTVFYFYQEIHAILILAFVGGYIDAFGYIKCDGLFTSSITGNLVAACASIYVVYGVVARVFVSLGFLLGGFVGFLIAAKLKRAEEWKAKPISLLLYVSQVLLFLIAFAVGLHFDQAIEDNGNTLSDWRLVLVATILGGSMGMHNAAAKESIPNVPSTTVMTMTMVSELAALAQLLANFLADKLLVRFSPKWKEITEDEHKKMHARVLDAVDKWIVVTRPLVAFLVGALVGTALASHITYYGLFVTSFLIATLFIDNYFAIVVERVEHSLLAISSTESSTKGTDSGKALVNYEAISTKEQNESSTAKIQEIPLTAV